MSHKIQYCPGCGSRCPTQNAMVFRALICIHCGGQYYIRRKGNMRKREKRIVKFPKEIDKQLRRIVSLSLEDKEPVYVNFDEFSRGSM